MSSYMIDENKNLVESGRLLDYFSVKFNDTSTWPTISASEYPTVRGDCFVVNLLDSFPIPPSSEADFKISVNTNIHTTWLVMKFMNGSSYSYPNISFTLGDRAFAYNYGIVMNDATGYYDLDLHGCIVDYKAGFAYYRKATWLIMRVF